MTDTKFKIKVVPFKPKSALFTQSDDARVPLHQHPFYLSALQTFGTNAKLIQVLRGDQIVLKFFALERTFLGVLNLTMGFRGPSFAQAITTDEKIAALKYLRKQYSPWRREFLQLMPELVDSAENKSVMKRAGYTRIMTGTSTIWLDLMASEAELRNKLAGNWRNQLKKAEQSNITVAVGGNKPKHYNWLLEKESTQRTARGYSAVPLGLVPAYSKTAAPVPLMSVTAHEGGTQVAGALFLLHGNSSTYHIGWAGEKGRSLNAQNHVLFTAVMALKERGIKWLDMGGVDTGPQAAIARFKLGLGHPPETLVGTYIS